MLFNLLFFTWFIYLLIYFTQLVSDVHFYKSLYTYVRNFIFKKKFLHLKTISVDGLYNMLYISQLYGCCKCMNQQMVLLLILQGFESFPSSISSLYCKSGTGGSTAVYNFEAASPHITVLCGIFTQQYTSSGWPIKTRE